MVVQGDLTVELVQADSKIPFKEHVKDGKVYVEVEPEAEYFIKLQKTGNSIVSKDILCRYVVDEHDLGYHTSYSKDVIQKNSGYQGLWSRINGAETTTALKFVKPRIQKEDSGGSSAASRRPPPRHVMGKIQVNIFERISCGVRETRHNFESSIVTAPVDPGLNLAKKKSLRTGVGTNNIAGPVVASSKAVDKCRRGALIDTITLHYCAALGLIEAGVLPKPADVWAPDLMLKLKKYNSKRAASVKQENDEDIQVIPAPKKVRGASSSSNGKKQESEVIDLCDDSDDED